MEGLSSTVYWQGWEDSMRSRIQWLTIGAQAIASAFISIIGISPAVAIITIIICQPEYRYFAPFL